MRDKPFYLYGLV